MDDAVVAATGVVLAAMFEKAVVRSDVSRAGTGRIRTLPSKRSTWNAM